MDHLRVALCLAVCASALSGCAIVRSAEGAKGGVGFAYQLPRALLPVELIYDGAGFDLLVKAPKIIGDGQKTYVMQRSANVFSSDNVATSVGDGRSLLNSVVVSSDDKSLSGFINLVAGYKARKAESGEVPAAEKVSVFRKDFDPEWSEDEVRAFNSDLTKSADRFLNYLWMRSSCNTAATKNDCLAIALLGETLKLGGLAVMVDGLPRIERLTEVDCALGVCYRINVPTTVTLRSPTSLSSDVLPLPNSSPTFVLPLERWAFVKTTHNVTFKDGVLQAATTDRPSSAYELMTAPLALAKAVWAELTNLVQFKIDLSGKEKALAEAKTAELTAIAAYEAKLLEKLPKKAEAALWGVSDGDREVRLALRIGPVSQKQDALKDLGKGGDGKGGASPKTDGGGVTPIPQPAVPKVPKDGVGTGKSSDGDLGKGK